MKKSFLLTFFCFLFLTPAYAQEDSRPFITTWNVPGEGSFTIPLSNNHTYDFEFYVIQENDTLSSGTHTNADGTFDFFSFQSITVELHIYGQFPHFANYSKDLLLDVNQWGDIELRSMRKSFMDWQGETFSAIDVPDLSFVNSMASIFEGANFFNGDVTQWDVSNVNNMERAFRVANRFNQDISSWNVGAVTNMHTIFRQASDFDQDLSGWNISQVSSMLNMFFQSGLSANNYDKLLNGWANLADSIGVINDVRFDAPNIPFCKSEESRNFLINNFNWNIFDGGEQCSSDNAIVSFAPFPFLSLVDNTIDINNHLVQVYLEPTTDFTNITPDIEVSANASVSPASGASVDLSSPVTFTVTALDDTEQEWTVEVLSRPFTTTWQVIAADETITIPTNIGDHFQYKWLKDGFEIETGFHNDVEDGDFSTTFSEVGNYQLEILGYFTHFVDYPKDKLLDVVQWGDIVWNNMESSFKDWPGAGFSAIDAPDLTNVTNMRNMFFNASNFNSPLNHWDVSNITAMRNLFSSASSFNQDLGSWNVCQVTDFESVFRNAIAFNGNIANWQVNEATIMFLMFSGAENFNKDITNWQTGKVRDMRGMFSVAKAFNQNISQWNVGSVENMGGMFDRSLNFNHDLSSWNIANVSNMAGMFNLSGLSPQNFDKTLNGWAAQEVQENVTLGAEGITFCKGAEARELLIADHNWEITDSDQECSSATNITFFDTNLENGLGILDFDNHIISLAVAEGTDVSAIVPTINLSPGATVSPALGTPVDLTNVIYTVTAEDGITTQEYTIVFTGPRFITTWIVEDAEQLVLEGSDSGFPYDFQFVITDDNNTFFSSGRADSFSGTLPLVAGEYRLEITGELPHFVGYPADQLLDVLQWGDIQWKTMRSSFANWEGTEFSATDTPDLSLVTDMNSMLTDANSFNGDLSNWDVSTVENMTLMFHNAMAFDGDISSWNVENVNNMAFMFFGASAFDRDLSSWDVSSLEAGELTGADEMFVSSGLSPKNYDNILIGWSQKEVQNNVSLGAPGINFCKGAAARQALIDDYSWIIDDAGLSCSSETDILTFAIAEQIGESTINSENHTVTLSVPFGTDRSALSPVFTLSSEATSNPFSGEVVNLSSPQAFVITAEDGTTTQDWIVTVNLLPNTATDIHTFTVSEQEGGTVIDLENHTVTLSVPFGTDRRILSPVFTLSFGATSNPLSGEVVNLSSPQAFVITAEDGTTTQEWTAIVNVLPNTATDILTFTLNEQEGEVVIDIENHTVTLSVPFGTDRSELFPEFTLSSGAISNPASGEVIDLNSPQTFVITAEDGFTVQAWSVTVILLPNTATDLLTFTVNEQLGVSTIDAVNHSVSLSVPFGTDRSVISPEFTLSSGATSNPASGEVVDLSSPQVFLITAQDGVTTQEWTVTADVLPNAATDILTVAVTQETEEVTIDKENNIVSILLSNGTDISAVDMLLIFSEGATSSIGASGSFDLTQPLITTVTAADGVSTQEWTIAAEVVPNGATDILAITSIGEIKDLTIDDFAHTINIVFAENTNLSSVPLEILVSQGATINVENNANLDLSVAVKIIVTAEDNLNSQEWTIIGTKEAVLSVEKEQLNISYYPNPVQDVLHISNQNGASIYMLDMMGKVVMTEQNGQHISIDMRAFKPGIYILYLSTANSSSTYKITKQ